MKRTILTFLLLMMILFCPVSQPAEATEESGPDGSIIYNSSSIQISGSGVSLKKNGTVRIREGGSYRITGNSSKARIVVDAAGEDVTIVLDNCDLSWADDEVIYFKEAASARIVLADNSENRLQSGAGDQITAADAEATGAVLRASCPLAIGGSGSLQVFGFINNGIASDGNITIENGFITVSAANDALKSRGDILIADGTLDLSSMNDALQADGCLTVSGGTLTLNASDDAVRVSGDMAVSGGLFSISALDDAVHCDGGISFAGGTLNILTSHEGLESAGILITGGRIGIRASDDGINVSGDASVVSAFPGSDFRMQSGIVTICSGGDGIDSNRSVYLEGGTVIISGASADWDSAIDFGERGEFVIDGGTVIAAGFSGMAESPSPESSQLAIFYCFDEIIPENTEFTVTAEDGKIICLYSFENAYNCVIVSTPDISAGQTYRIEAGNYYDSIVLSSSGFSNKKGFSGEPFPGGSGDFPGAGSFGHPSSDPTSEISN